METEKVACDWNVGGSLHIYRSAKGLERLSWNRYPVEAVRNTGATPGQEGHAWVGADPGKPRQRRLALQTDRPSAARTAHVRVAADSSPSRCTDIGELSRFKPFDRKRAMLSAIVTKDAELSADAFVLATGAWTPSFENRAGVQAPDSTGKGLFHHHGSTADHFPGSPAFLKNKAWSSPPWPDECRLGGTMEFSGFDDRLNQRRLWALARGLDGYFDQWQFNGRKKEWCGFRPMTVDGLPFIDRSPRMKNVMIAAGHNMIGLSAAPGTGKLVAEIMAGNHAPYRSTSLPHCKAS